MSGNLDISHSAVPQHSMGIGGAAPSQHTQLPHAVDGSVQGAVNSHNALSSVPPEHSLPTTIPHTAANHTLSHTKQKVAEKKQEITQLKTQVESRQNTIRLNKQTLAGMPKDHPQYKTLKGIISKDEKQLRHLQTDVAYKKLRVWTTEHKTAVAVGKILVGVGLIAGGAAAGPAGVILIGAGIGMVAWGAYDLYKQNQDKAKEAKSHNAPPPTQPAVQQNQRAVDQPKAQTAPAAHAPHPHTPLPPLPSHAQATHAAQPPAVDDNEIPELPPPPPHVEEQEEEELDDGISPPPEDLPPPLPEDVSESPRETKIEKAETEKSQEVETRPRQPSMSAKVVSEFLETEKSFNESMDKLVKASDDLLNNEAKLRNTKSFKEFSKKFPGINFTKELESIRKDTIMIKTVSDNFVAKFDKINQIADENLRNQKFSELAKSADYQLCLLALADYSGKHGETFPYFDQAGKEAGVIDSLVQGTKHETFSTFAIMPIQRAMRYAMLLEDYAKKLPKDESNAQIHENLAASMSITSTIAQSANKVKLPRTSFASQFSKDMKTEDIIKKVITDKTLHKAISEFKSEARTIIIAQLGQEKADRVFEGISKYVNNKAKRDSFISAMGKAAVPEDQANETLKMLGELANPGNSTPRVSISPR